LGSFDLSIHNITKAAGDIVCHLLFELNNTQHTTNNQQPITNNK
jgi:hypothetical protein